MRNLLSGIIEGVGMGESLNKYIYKLPTPDLHQFLTNYTIGLYEI